ncbi:PAS domain-containing protein [Kineococcus sp. SYSU DK005]|uniref:PAS domain-containing protein n=1 Tax=Kineococcus sp. SYSU DK005 TaxID=3383126 RepID=UPI003D7DCB5F
MSSSHGERERQARARQVRDAVRQMWGEEMPPTEEPDLSVFDDAVSIDDERGRGRGLVVQGDGLSHQVLADLLSAHPDARRFLPQELIAQLSPLLQRPRTQSPGARSSGAQSPSNSPGEPVDRSADDALSGVGVLLDPQVGAWELNYRSGTLSWDEQCAALLDLHTRAGDRLEAQLSSWVHPEDRERVAQALARAVDSGQRYEARFRVRMGDGSYAWRLSSGRVIDLTSDSGPRIIGVIAALPD